MKFYSLKTANQNLRHLFWCSLSSTFCCHFPLRNAAWWRKKLRIPIYFWFRFFHILWIKMFLIFSFIGYRLGFNYLKAKRFVDAIDVCHKVKLYFIWIDLHWIFYNLIVETVLQEKKPTDLFVEEIWCKPQIDFLNSLREVIHSLFLRRRKRSCGILFILFQEEGFLYNIIIDLILILWFISFLL